MKVTCRSILTLPYANQLKPVAGKEGMDHVISWVYYMEEPHYIEWLKGGELVLITGLVTKEREDNNMVKLLVGHKGTGKTKQMIDLANEQVENSNGSIIFINKNSRLMYDLKYKIRVVCMEEYEHITNSDEYIGFIYGIISSDHDIETIYIDSILKHADFSLGDIPEFLSRLRVISKNYGMDFVVSLSAEKEEMIGVDFSEYEVLN